MLPPGNLASLPRDVLITGLIFTLTLSTASSLKCLQCMSLHNQRCETGDVEATECEDENANAKYCVKYSGKIQLGEFVVRACSMKVWNTPCHKKMMEGELVNVCYATCDTDGCNTATTMSTPQLSSLIPAIVFSIVCMLCVS